MNRNHTGRRRPIRRRATRRGMGVILAGAAAALTLGLSACGNNGGGGAAAAPTVTGSGSGTITWWANQVTGVNMNAQIVSAFEKLHPNIHIKLVNAPVNTDTNKSTLISQISGGGGPDVYNGDVIWPAQFAAAGLALDLAKYFDSSFWNTFKGATYRGGIYGVPLFSDQGFFYYRKDLLAKAHLPVPTTWEQVQSESKTLQQQGLVKYGMIFQGASYEGLTCNYTEFLADAGGSILNADSTAPAIDSPQGVKALTYLRGLITSGVTPAAVTSFQEPQAMNVFQSGDAAFLRNWAYAWGDANDPSVSKVAGKVGVSLPPTFAGQSGSGHSNIGGWNAYINPNSKNISADVTFLKFLASPAAQGIVAHASEIPTVQSVRASPAVADMNPVFALLGQSNLVARPSTTKQYATVSQAVYTNVNSALSGAASPAAALTAASSAIKDALSGGI
jgi:multiple sugar transport system substrate-binding protein